MEYGSSLVLQPDQPHPPIYLKDTRGIFLSRNCDVETGKLTSSENDPRHFQATDILDPVESGEFLPRLVTTAQPVLRQYLQ